MSGDIKLSCHNLARTDSVARRLFLEGEAEKGWNDGIPRVTPVLTLGIWTLETVNCFLCMSEAGIELYDTIGFFFHSIEWLQLPQEMIYDLPHESIQYGTCPLSSLPQKSNAEKRALSYDSQVARFLHLMKRGFPHPTENDFVTICTCTGAGISSAMRNQHCQQTETGEKGHKSRKSKKQFHLMCCAGGCCFWLG